MCGLKVRFSQSPERRGVFFYALRVEVISSEGIPSKIFVYHQSPAGIDGNTFAEFDHIASPVDFQEIPEDAASATVPWYRTDKCTVWVRSLEDLKTAKQLFVDDIGSLQRTFDMLKSEDNFENQATIEFSDEGIHGIDPDHGDDKPEAGVLDGVVLSSNTMDGIRSAVETIGRSLGATIEND